MSNYEFCHPVGVNVSSLADGLMVVKIPAEDIKHEKVKYVEKYSTLFCLNSARFSS